MKDVFCLLSVAALMVLSPGYEEPQTRRYGLIPVHENCKCIPFYLCSNGSVIDDGKSLIDIRISSFGCESYLDVCCETPLIESDSDDKVDEFVEGIQTDYTSPGKGAGETPLIWESCGVHHPEGVAFHISGITEDEAQFGEFPWMTAILLTEGVTVKESPDDLMMKHAKIYLCGGALIHPQVVLTGAHCVESHKNSSLIVRVGEWDSRTIEEIYQHQELVVSEVLIHPHFNRRNLFNDVALLFLSEQVTPAKHIGFVCLPKKNQVPPQGTRCLASGWGRDSFGDTEKYRTILKRVDLPIVGRGHCQRNLRRTRLGAYFRLHESFMCAGGEKGKDTCKGDGGSPLVCPHPMHPEHYIQTGIVAWGIGCQDPEVPGVYADVAHFRNWIDQKMMEHYFDTTYYTL